MLDNGGGPLCIDGNGGGPVHAPPSGLAIFGLTVAAATAERPCTVRSSRAPRAVTTPTPPRMAPNAPVSARFLRPLVGPAACGEVSESLFLGPVCWRTNRFPGDDFVSATNCTPEERLVPPPFLPLLSAVALFTTFSTSTSPSSSSMTVSSRNGRVMSLDAN